MDLTDLELGRQAQPRNISELSDEFSDLFVGLTLEQFDVIHGAGAGLMIRLLALDRFQLLRRWSLRTVSNDAYRHLSPVMVEERNSGALARLPLDADAVLLWGSDHLPGLAAGLKKAGYRHRRTAWVSVGELPAVWSCIRAFLTWLRASGKNDSAPAPKDADPPAPSPAS